MTRTEARVIRWKHKVRWLAKRERQAASNWRRAVRMLERAEAQRDAALRALTISKEIV